MKKIKVTFNPVQLDYSCELMRALAHPLRLKILEFIDRNGSVNVNKIYSSLKIEQSVTSQHLSILRITGVISTEKLGKFVHCSINYPCLEKAEKAVNNFLGRTQAQA
ncbi:MAG: helix-turn-helix transcriptional regulator [Saprospiraceae bacterium]|nr:helix-turn-helix transcriptional regulator [Saprospiraceae bacterium]MBK8451217.1 helix-turn-helix transcriptional regulator [Saprospiraceae bacterium]MBK8483179.1 helix-turn-helix transcriptional regulator [Saprospiraceae bacterium]MBK9220691.1 helix-turn-helix transcriptional regulator [Saprospiraceae bacterium]MBK9722465.1 helix-turn-helix transcriptional regulator [Saprospiraceae bacterium]